MFPETSCEKQSENSGAFLSTSIKIRLFPESGIIAVKAIPLTISSFILRVTAGNA
jgi:hypothetical protein